MNRRSFLKSLFAGAVIATVPVKVIEFLTPRKALTAEYTYELASELENLHSIDAETELARILSEEIIREMNQEMTRMIVSNASPTGFKFEMKARAMPFNNGVI